MRVAISGGFDPLHLGHVDHIRKAKKLGDYLIVILQSDDNLVKKKGYCFMPYTERVEIMKSLRYVDEVVMNIDNDMTSAETLRKVKPDLYAKGGDRTPNNMPENEVEACKEIGCQIVYGIGDQLDSSSLLVAKALWKVKK